MTNIQQHPIFADAPAEDAPLWRYMTFAKLASLLRSKRVRFTRIDQFDDHFEGVWPREDLVAWNKLSTLPAGFTELMRRSRVAASCWVHLPHESAGMWRLYASGTEGVAIKTTFGNLLAVTRAVQDSEREVLAGAANVRYIDHASESLLASLQEGEHYPNLLVPFMLKHESYEHEHEVRALVVAPAAQEIEPNGFFSAELDLANFIDAVVTNPFSQPWFEEVVIELAKANGIENVRRSALDRRLFWQSVVPAEQALDGTPVSGETNGVT